MLANLTEEEKKVLPPDEYNLFAKACSQELLEDNYLPDSKEQFFQVWVKCSKNDQHIIGHSSKVPSHYCGGNANRYCCSDCKDEFNVAEEKVWRCDNQDCPDDYCMKCWNKRVVKAYLLFKVECIKRKLSEEQKAAIDKKKVSNNPIKLHNHKLSSFVHV